MTLGNDPGVDALLDRVDALERSNADLLAACQGMLDGGPVGCTCACCENARGAIRKAVSEERSDEAHDAPAGSGSRESGAPTGGEAREERNTR